MYIGLHVYKCVYYICMYVDTVCLVLCMLYVCIGPMYVSHGRGLGDIREYFSQIYFNSLFLVTNRSTYRKPMAQMKTKTRLICSSVLRTFQPSFCLKDNSLSISVNCFNSLIPVNSLFYLRRLQMGQFLFFDLNCPFTAGKGKCFETLQRQNPEMKIASATRLMECSTDIND